MKRDDRPGDSELQRLLTRGREIPPLPDVIRARALARARATVAMAPAAYPPVPTAAEPRRRLWIAVAASLALIFGAAGATAALRGWLPWPREPRPASSPPLLPAVPAAPSDRPAARPQPPQSTATIKPERPGRRPTAQESYAVELQLLQRAQDAYGRRDFSGTLALVAEHGRRFPNGRLAEQREALRVRSLAGSGRGAEARRAAAAFAARFPRSVLLQHLEETGSAPASTGH